MPESSSASPVAVSVKRACDGCHRRKVKCIPPGNADPLGPCKNCQNAGLKCTFNAIPQKKGPKGSRAKVISELRETQRLTTGGHEFASPPGSPLVSLPGQPLSPELISSCVDFFFHNVYPTQPILRRNETDRLVATMNSNPEAYCFVSVLCAYMMIQPNMELPQGSDFDVFVDSSGTLSLGKSVLNEALEVRKRFPYIESPSTTSVATSFFFFGCYFCLENHNLAWFHLREATTLALLIGMHREESYQHLAPDEAVTRRRLYWLLFVTERAYAIQTQRPLSLHDTITLPTESSQDEPLELSGFIHLVRLYKPFDDAFVGLWNRPSEGTSTEWIVALQRQLHNALPQYLNSTPTQLVDLKTSQIWLQTMVWQLSINQRLLASVPVDQSLSFKYPLELSRQMLAQARQFQQPAMEVHGIGLVSKIFDIACTLADVISCVPLDHHDSFSVGPRDYLHNFIELISKLRGGQQRYLPVLLSKAGDTLAAGPQGPLGRTLPSSHHNALKREPSETTPLSDYDSPSVAAASGSEGYADFLDEDTPIPVYSGQFHHGLVVPSANSFQPQHPPSSGG